MTVDVKNRQVMSSILVVVVPSIIGIFGICIVLIYFNKSYKLKIKRFSDRIPLTHDEIYIKYFSNSGVSKKRVKELWLEIAEVLELPAEQLLPSDRFAIELAPHVGYEFCDQISDMNYIISKRCLRTKINQASINTIEDYIIAFKNDNVSI